MILDISYIWIKRGLCGTKIRRPN